MLWLCDHLAGVRRVWRGARGEGRGAWRVARSGDRSRCDRRLAEMTFRRGRNGHTKRGRGGVSGLHRGGLCVCVCVGVGLGGGVIVHGHGLGLGSGRKTENLWTKTGPCHSVGRFFRSHCI